ncbi:MAG: TatD family hydrolase [Coriobacteriaceae bacterium]|nr:TatD family hydrolase [Coriobacteriaceae bacterium]
MPNAELRNGALLDAPTRCVQGLNMPDRPWHMVDMHCHLDRMTNGAEVASELERMGIAAFCTTVTPYEALDAQSLLAAYPNVRVGIGLHPWWVNEGPLMSESIEQAAQLAASSGYVGEIGLDFSPAHATTRAMQLDAFEQIVAACAEHPRQARVLSIHAVRAAAEALDILERHRMAGDATCIFHWFSGSSDDLVRLRSLNCYLSINERMLATKRGRSYAQQMPVDRVLLETDAPVVLDTPSSTLELEASLARTLRALAVIRRIDENELASRIAMTSSELLGIS